MRALVWNRVERDLISSWVIGMNGMVCLMFASHCFMLGND